MEEIQNSNVIATQWARGGWEDGYFGDDGKESYFRRDNICFDTSRIKSILPINN